MAKDKIPKPKAPAVEETPVIDPVPEEETFDDVPMVGDPVPEEETFDDVPMVGDPVPEEETFDDVPMVGDPVPEEETSDEAPTVEETPVNDYVHVATTIEYAHDTPEVGDLDPNRLYEVKPISNREAARALREKHQG